MELSKDGEPYKEINSKKVVNDKQEDLPEYDTRIFKGLNIFVEIFNNSTDQSEILDEVLVTNGANIIKRLNKSIAYIIFKEGKNKTVEHALNNKIKLVNPLWVHESISENKLLDADKYLINKNFTDLYVGNNDKKRKYDQLSRSPQKKEENLSKKKKTDPKINTNLTVIKKEVEEENINNISNENNNSKDFAIKNVPNTKITNFFKPQIKLQSQNSENSSKIKSHESEPLIKISSIGLGEEGKFKVNSCVKTLGKYIYLGEKIDNIKESEFVIVNEVHNKNDIKYFYSMINNKIMISLKYFVESKNENKFKSDLTDYIKTYVFNSDYLNCLKSKDDLLFKVEKYKMFLHQSLFEKEPNRKEIFMTLLEYLGNEIETNIRLSDICIINKEDTNEHFPGHVKLLNENFLFDCFYNNKIIDMENMKYFPEKVNVKKNIK